MHKDLIFILKTGKLSISIEFRIIILLLNTMREVTEATPIAANPHGLKTGSQE